MSRPTPRTWFAALAFALTPLVAAQAQLSRVEGQDLKLTLGESLVLQLTQPVTRVAVGHPGVTDYVLLSPKELYLLGKSPGETNLVMWTADGRAQTLRTQVSLNLNSLRELLRKVLPTETEIELLSAGEAIILKGVVSDASAAETAHRIVSSQLQQDRSLASSKDSAETKPAAATTGKEPARDTARETPSLSQGARIVNLLKIRQPQQVMLEVRVAEVSKSYLESLGVEWSQTGSLNDGSLMTGFVSNARLSLLLGRGASQKVNPDGSPLFSNRTLGVKVEAQRKDGWVKILAEPTIVAMSGQEGRFLVGGKIFIPVNQALGSTTYEERSYGVGLRFVPTVLESGRINLRVAPEVSEPVKESVTAGTKDSLPAFKSSYVSTTVQMAEGENLVIGGLLRDNVNEIIKAVPLLGDVPVLGALFRYSQYITERTELLIMVRPSLVKASASMPALPTDNFTPPTRSEFFLGGQLEGGKPPSDRRP